MIPIQIGLVKSDLNVKNTQHIAISLVYNHFNLEK